MLRHCKSVTSSSSLPGSHLCFQRRPSATAAESKHDRTPSSKTVACNGLQKPRKNRCRIVRKSPSPFEGPLVPVVSGKAIAFASLSVCRGTCAACQGQGSRRLPERGEETRAPPTPAQTSTPATADQRPRPHHTATLIRGVVRRYKNSICFEVLLYETVVQVCHRTMLNGKEYAPPPDDPAPH